MEKKQLLGLLASVTGNNGSLDGSLNGSTIGNSLVGVDALVGFLALEEVRHELDDTGDTRGTAHEDGLPGAARDCRKQRPWLWSYGTMGGQRPLVRREDSTGWCN
jgi:hypothetical protein